MKKWSLPATMIALSALAILVYKNPSADDFERFAAAYIRENLASPETMENGAANVLGVAGAVVAAKSTKRIDLIALSLYSGEGAGYRWSVVGLAGNFLPLRIEKLPSPEPAVASRAQPPAVVDAAPTQISPPEAAQAIGSIGKRSPDEIPISPSFDCQRATHPMDRKVCENWDLAAQDQGIAKLYAFQLKDVADREIVRFEQNAWIKQKMKCTDAECLGSSYLDRFTVMLSRSRKALEQAQAVHAVGDCMLDRITELEPPQSAFDEGAIRTAKGIVGIESERMLYPWRWSEGNEVLVCLESVPSSCPPGDDRGRVHFFFSVSSREPRSMPDSAHSCGGA